MGKWDVNSFLLKFDKQWKISTFPKSLFQTMFLSKRPNLAENPDPADRPEACGERRGGKIGAEKGRYVVTNPKPTVSNVATFTWGKKEALPSEFSTVRALLGVGFRVFSAKQGGQAAKHLSSGQEDLGPRWPRITLGIPLHCTESITWHKQAGEIRDQSKH